MNRFLTNRKALLLILLLGVAYWYGRDRIFPTPPKRAGDFDQTAIEAELKRALMLKDIHLTEEKVGKYAGTGTRIDGVRCKITVTKSANRFTWESEDERGAKIIGSKQWTGSQGH
jgi:hypothetical protein